MTLVSRNNYAAGRDVLESYGDANRDARKELLAYSNVLSFGRKIPGRSCEGCGDDEVHDDHPAEMTESLSDDSPWAHRFMRKGELYSGENRGKAAVGADCYYTHSVSYCDGQQGQQGQALSNRAADVQSRSTELSRAEKKARALAMDGDNTYDMDCFYQHEVSWCMSLHAKQKAQLKAKDFVKFAQNRDSAYSSDPELSGLARMVHRSEPVSQLKEDERFSHQAQQERAKRDHEARQERQARYRQKEVSEEAAESAERERRAERREARANADAHEERDSAARGDDSNELRKVEQEARREKQVAKQELKQQLVAQQKEEAAEAELKAAKAQLHALATKRLSDHSTRGSSASLPALHRLPVEPALENAEPVEGRPEKDVAVPRDEARSRSDKTRRPREYEVAPEASHRAYSLSIRKQEPGSYPLSVRQQEPKGFTKTAISWDKAHGVRPIDSLQQERKARSIELADWSRAKSQKLFEGHIQKPSLELADFTVGEGADVSRGEGSDDEAAANQANASGQLEQEALRDGLTLVPLDKSATEASTLVHRGLASDSRWEAREGLKAVSAGARREQGARSLFLGLHSQDLLKDEEIQGDAWERRHHMIAFTSHKDEHTNEEPRAEDDEHRRRVLGDNEVPIAQADGREGQPAAGSKLVERAVDEATEVGAAGVKALGFDNSEDFEKHLEKEGI